MRGCGRGRRIARPSPGQRWVFLFDGGGEVDVAVARFQVALVAHADTAQVFSEGGEEAGGEHGHAGYFSGVVADVDLAIVKIEVLDTEAEALDQPQAEAEYEFGDELVGAGHGGDHGHGFFSGEDDGQVVGGFFGPDGGDGGQVYLEHLVVEEQDGAEGLVLGGGRDVFIHGQVGEEGFDFGVAHRFGVAFVVEQDVSFDPLGVGLFGADGVLFISDGVTDLVEQFFSAVCSFQSPGAVARPNLWVYTN